MKLRIVLLSIFSYSNLVLCSAFIHTINQSDPFQNSEDFFENEEYRLPGSFSPINYKLELMTIMDPTPGFQRFTAPAKIWITVGCQDEASVITLHAINLTINENTVQVKNAFTGTNVGIEGISYEEEFDFLHIELDAITLLGQQYEIYVEFLIPIYDNRLNGMYLDFYDNPDTGDRRYIATTLFAPYHARRTFPCFDEPAYRATYNITIGHHTDFHAMSNTEIIETKPIDNMPGWVWDTFRQTPSMSSYIIAMIISDMSYEQAPTGSFRDVEVRVYAKPEAIQKGAATYSAKLVGDVMTYFETLFIEKYPISKIYSVALPQFFFSAMENYGLITYKEPVLLYLPEENTEDERYRINYVLSHEKAHQYFGNLIACRWWAYVWLKEGFATYFSHYGINFTNPEMNPWAQFVPRVLQVAMDFDTTNQTHPLENFPPTSASVADIYSRIPYEKGASILRMASAILTEPVFMDGVRRYVNSFKYSNADQNALFASLQSAVNESPQIYPLLPTSVKEILDTWTTQAGYPMVKVSVIGPNEVEITQEKFIEDDPTSPLDTWWVPVFVTPRPNASLPAHFPDTWVPQYVRSTRFSMPTNQFIIVNPGAIGYYRVLYDAGLLEKIKYQLQTNHRVIPSEARSQILNDYLNFALEGYQNIDTAFTLMNYLDQETDLVVWLGLEPIISRLSKHFFGTETYNYLQAFFAEKSSKAFRLLGPERVRGEKTITKSLLMQLACRFEDTSCLDYAHELYEDWIQTGLLNSIPSDLQETVFCTEIARDRSGTVWNNFMIHLIKIKQSDSFGFSPVKDRILEALTCSKDLTSLKDLIALVAEDSSDKLVLTPGEKSKVLRKLVDNHKGKNLILETLNSSPDLLRIFKSNDELADFMGALAAYILEDAEIDMIERAGEQMPMENAHVLDSFIIQTERTREIYSRISGQFRKD